ncbi:Maf family protein, partial [Arcobacter sp.]
MIRLGSKSPTRAKILKAHNIEFIQSGGEFDEDTITTQNPKSFAYQATLGKFDELYKKYGVEEYPLLVSDSVVTANDLLLRKAKDKN